MEQRSVIIEGYINGICIPNRVKGGIFTWRQDIISSICHRTVFRCCPALQNMQTVADIELTQVKCLTGGKYQAGISAAAVGVDINNNIPHGVKGGIFAGNSIFCGIRDKGSVLICPAQKCMFAVFDRVAAQINDNIGILAESVACRRTAVGIQ